MRFVKDEEPLSRAGAEMSDERIAIFGSAKKRMRDDEAVVRGPRVHAEAALLAPIRDKLPRRHLKAEPKAPLHLGLPLKADRRRTGDEHKIRLLA